jgi:hypothetical protein
MLVAVCGLQGVGKSAVARRISDICGAELLRTDSIRKELFERPSYTGEEMQKVYDAMFSRAKESLESSYVVLDATFARRENRLRAREIAAEAEKEFRLVEVVCCEETVRQRIGSRKGDDSEAGFEHYLKYKSLFEPVEEEHIVIDNSGTLEETYRQVDVYFGLQSPDWL